MDFLLAPEVISKKIARRRSIRPRGCAKVSVCYDFTDDPPTRPTVIFQWVGVSLILAQRESMIMPFLASSLSSTILSLKISVIVSVSRSYMIFIIYHTAGCLRRKALQGRSWGFRSLPFRYQIVRFFYPYIRVTYLIFQYVLAPSNAPSVFKIKSSKSELREGSQA